MVNMEISKVPKRTASAPRKHIVRTGDEEDNQTLKQKKHKSLTFKERLRSTFIRSYRKKVKAYEEVVYGKVVMLGDEGVGKTSLVHRFSNNYFTSQYIPTGCTATFEVTAIVECETRRRENNNTDAVRKTALLNQHVRSSPVPGMRTNRRSSTEHVLSISHKHVARPSTTGKNMSMKEFKFQLIDDVYNVNTAAPISYRATASDAHGFILVCSYDKPNSVDYLKNIYDDIKDLRQSKEVPVIIVANKCDQKTNESEQFEHDVQQFADQNGLEWASTSAANSEGFEKLTELMLNEMQSFEEEDSKENNLPDYYAFIEEDRRHPGIFKQWKLMI